MYKFLSRGWYVIFLLLLTSTAYGQKSNITDSHLLIESNFDSVYVIIDDTISSARHVANKELISLEAGKHAVTIIPKYAPTYTFEKSFSADSFYVARLNFGYITDEQNPIHKKFESEDLSSLSELEPQRRNYLKSGSFGIQEYNQQEFKKWKENPSPDFQNTYLKVVTNTDSLYVRPSAGSKKVYKIASGDSIPIIPGNNRITISHPNAEEFNYRRTSEPGTTTEIAHTFKIRESSVETLTENISTKQHYDANLVIVSDPDSRILVNGIEAGNGAARVNQPTGPVTIVIENPKTGRHVFYRKIANLPGERAMVVDAYTKPAKNTAQFLSLLPGGSQFYKKQGFKASFILGGFITAAGLAILENENYNSELANFNRIKSDYQAAREEFRALELGNQMEAKHAQLQDINKKRTTFLALAGLFYAYNLVDGLLNTPRQGYKQKTDLNLHLNRRTITGHDYSSISLSYAF